MMIVNERISGNGGNGGGGGVGGSHRCLSLWLQSKQPQKKGKKQLNCVMGMILWRTQTERNVHLFSSRPLSVWWNNNPNKQTNFYFYCFLFLFCFCFCFYSEEKENKWRIITLTYFLHFNSLDQVIIKIALLQT